MEQHTGIMAHDGYAEHSHEVRSDHHCVSRTWPPYDAGSGPAVRSGKSNLAGPALARQAAANAGALDDLAGLLRASPRLDDADLIDALFDIVGQTGRITDPDSLDTMDDPAEQALRDALMPWACRYCGTEVMAPGSEPGHAEWCPTGPDAVADAKAALHNRIVALAGASADVAEALLEDLLYLAEDDLDSQARTELVARVLAGEQGVATVTKGDVIRIVPERGPERVMTVAHVEHHVITLADNVTAWEVVPGEVMTVDARSAGEAIRAAIAERDEIANGKGYEPDPNPCYWARRAGTRGPWQRVPA